MHNLFRTLLLPIAALFAVTAVSAQNVSWKSTVEHLDGDMYRIVLEASIPAPYHMYDMGPYEGGPNATTITFTAGAGATLEGGVEQLSTPERHYDKTFEMEIGSFAGDIHKAHEAGCEFVKSLAGVEPVECEIAITTNGGYPLDQNIYQAVKGMCSAEATLPEGGVIIDVAGCADGHGGEGFYHNIADNDPAEFERACIDRPKDETLPDQWTSQIFARILAHHPVIMVTDLCDHQMIKDMHMTPVNTLDEALKLAFEMKGADAKVAVIPDGLGVVVAQH